MNGRMRKPTRLFEGIQPSGRRCYHAPASTCACIGSAPPSLDLAAAVSLGLDPEVAEAERAAVLQATGAYDKALTVFRAAAARRADFASLGALAVLHAERGDVQSAETFFGASRAAFRGVSPIPLALLDFQHGRMWMRASENERARRAFASAVRLVPAYAPAQGHLAEAEAAIGETCAAVSRLLPLTRSSDDPDYAAALARILRDAGREDEAAAWRAAAASRYDELLARHPDAFADHAAAFLLEPGGDPHRALAWAKRNLALRDTPRSRQLVARAARACGPARRRRGFGNRGNDEARA